MSSPSMRIGGKQTWVNVGKRGTSVTTRGKGWSYNSRRGCSIGCPGCLLSVLLCVGALLAIVRVGDRSR